MPFNGKAISLPRCEIGVLEADLIPILVNSVESGLMGPRGVCIWFSRLMFSVVSMIAGSFMLRGVYTTGCPYSSIRKVEFIGF